MERVVFDGDEKGGFPTGQCIGGIQDVPSVSELIERIVAEAEEAFESMKAKFSS